MKQLVVTACLVVTMVAAVRKEVTSIKIFFNKIITFIINIPLAKITIVTKYHCQNHHFDQQQLLCQDYHLDQHLPCQDDQYDAGGADGRGEDELELGVQRGETSFHTGGWVGLTHWVTSDHMLTF